MTIPCFMATGIGSMPFGDPDYAVSVGLKHLPEAPFWPQLPRLGVTEQMEVQYSEGMPCAVLDRGKSRLYFDTSVDYSEAFAGFYEAYMTATESADGDFSSMAVGPEYSKGIYAMEKQLTGLGKKLPFIKVQTVGPLTFALTVVDENKRALYYNDEFRDVIIKALAMKCRWQIRKFRGFADEVICFVDEPILSAFGSSTYVSVKREDVVAQLGEVIEAVHAENALAGVHCCGNTEWSILMDAGTDIISFDAFGFGETIGMYAQAVKAYLERGGMLAWGIVPTSKEIRTQDATGLVSRLNALIDGLAAKGIDKSIIVKNSLVTPSCGTGSLEPGDAERVFALTHEVSESMRAFHHCGR